MTIKVELQDDQAKQLEDLAQKMGIGAEELIRRKVLALLMNSQNVQLTRNEIASVPEPRAPHPKIDVKAALQKLRESLPPDFIPPTDAEVEQILDERRMRKYG